MPIANPIPMETTINEMNALILKYPISNTSNNIPIRTIARVISSVFKKQKLKLTLILASANSEQQ
jgi:hypothetical protein